MSHSVPSIVGLFLLMGVAAACGDSAAAGSEGAEQRPPTAVSLPNKGGSFKFAVLGDFGTGSRAQYQLAERMQTVHATFNYELVALVGDNIYGSDRPQDYERKFEIPYKPLLDAGVKFYGALGNHDSRAQRLYKPFNMGGKPYYTFSPKADVRFFVLESTYPAPEQIRWLEDELRRSGSKWKIAVFHHPLYSSGGRHGSSITLRKILEPLFVRYNVSVVLNGHDHVYERTRPQNGIVYFVVGSGGKLRQGDLDTSTGITAKGYDRDLAFMAAEIDGDVMTFNAISRLGQTVDSGSITRRQ